MEGLAHMPANAVLAVHCAIVVSSQAGLPLILDRRQPGAALYVDTDPLAARAAPAAIGFVALE